MLTDLKLHSLLIKLLKGCFVNNTMFPKIKISLIILFCSSNLSFAEEIFLKSGKMANGKIIEKNHNYIKIYSDGLTMPYWMEEIQSIDGQDIDTWKKNNKESILNTAEPEENLGDKLYYINQKYNIKLKIPQNWNVLSRDKNTEYFNLLKNMMPSSAAELVCFMSENPSNVTSGPDSQYNPLPLITIAQKVITLQNQDAVINARQAIANTIENQKQRIATEENGSSNSRIGFALVKNTLGEQIIRFPKIEEAPSPGENKKILYTTYMYSHINKENTKMYSYIMMCGCWLDDADRYINTLDEVAINLVALD